MNFLILTKDFQGYKLDVALGWDGASFTMGDGRRLSHQVFMATQENLTRVALGSDPTPIGEGSYQLPPPAEAALSFLEMEGMAVDKDLRLRRKLTDPFGKLKPGHIPPVIMMHMKVCHDLTKEKAKADPTATPDDESTAMEKRLVNLLWNGQHIGFVVGPGGNGMPAIVGIPDMSEESADLKDFPEVPKESGKFTMYGNQIVLTWQDHHLIPKNGQIYSYHRYLKVEDAPFETLEQAGKMGLFVTTDGVVCKDGKSALVSQGLSIDDFI